MGRQLVQHWEVSMDRIIQEIDFFQNEFKCPVVVFSFVKMQWSIAFGFLFLIISIFNQWLNVNALQEIVDMNRMDEKILLQTIEETKRFQGMPVLDNKLITMLETIEHENNNKRILFSFVESLNVYNGLQYSSYYEALSKGDIPGIWLTEISFSNNGQDVYLQGLSVSAHAIPLYVAKLKQFPAFSDKSFQSLDMLRRDDFPHYIEFILRTDLKSDDV